MTRIVTVPLRLIFASIGFSFLPAVQATPDDPEGGAMLQQARKIIAAYHVGEPASDAVLRVVYFHPNDRAPLPGYAELDRILNDVSDFYRDGLRRLGIDNQGLPLERKDGKLVLHVVQGRYPASDYSYSSGSETRREIKEALKDEFDVEREHVLVMYGLCDKEPDGRYVFNAPYYGNGSQKAGLCHAADCEILDPKLLTETSKQMVFTEHYYPRVTKTLAGFNTMYLGGTAHELGHGLGLFHDAGMEAERRFGTSLMGSGNLYYRNDLHDGGAPAFLARVSALHLISHPFFTGSNKGRWEKLQGGPTDVTFTTEDKVMRQYFFIQSLVGRRTPMDPWSHEKKRGREHAPHLDDGGNDLHHRHHHVCQPLHPCPFTVLGVILHDCDSLPRRPVRALRRHLSLHQGRR